ncbi:50S ribosomal protein L5 [Candidatus Pacearchaeota archaeon]|nr:50S ribosomal protein L5 [Candidatus Pacearchaeota archaeon]
MQKFKMAEKTKKIKTELKENKNQESNVMRKPRLEKVVLNCGGTADKLEKALKLLKILTGRKINEIESQKRIPTFGVRPGLKTGAMVTIRGKEKEALLKRLFGAVNNKIRIKQVQNNHFSFGIEEYLEIPDMEYQRDIGILGLDVTAVFKRAGKRVAFKKIKQSRAPRKQEVTKEEIIEYLTKLGINVE